MYENQIEGIKLDERITNLKKICETKKRNVFFSFAKKLETLFFVTIETRRNSDLFCTVSYFAKLKNNMKLSTLLTTTFKIKG